MGRDGEGRDRTERDGIPRRETGQEGEGRDGMERDGTGRRGTGSDVPKGARGGHGPSLSAIRGPSGPNFF